MEYAAPLARNRPAPSIERLLGVWAGHYAISVVQVVVATAWAMDLVADWRAHRRRDDLVPIWPLHQVQRTDAVMGELARHGIDAHACGQYLRSLLHIFGPFVPIVILVPAAARNEAVALIRTVVGVPAPAQADSPADEPPSESEAPPHEA